MLALADGPAQQRLEAALDEVGADHHEAIAREPRHRAVDPHAAGLVADRRIDDLAELGVDVRHDESVQHGEGVGALDGELAHERHVEQPDPLAHRPVLGLDERVVPLAAPGLHHLRQLVGAAGEEQRPLPAGRRVEVGAVGDEALVHRGTPHPPRRRGSPSRRRGVAEEHAELLDGAVAAVGPRRLVGLGAVGRVAREVHRRHPGRDPVGEHVADAPAEQDAERVEAAGEEEPGALGRLAEEWVDVGGEGLRAAEELAHPDVRQRGDARHRQGDVGLDAGVVGLDLAEGEVRRRAVEHPRRGDGLEQADEQAAGLLAVVAVGRRVLEHRQAPVHALERLGDQVVVLGRLQRDVHADRRAELAAPQPGSEHHRLGLDRPRRRHHAGHPLAAVVPHLGDAGRRDALQDRRTAVAGAACERHGDVDGVGTPLRRHVEARQQVRRLGDRPQV